MTKGTRNRSDLHSATSTNQRRGEDAVPGGQGINFGPLMGSACARNTGHTRWYGTRFVSHGAPIYSDAVSPDGAMFATAGEHDRVNVYQMATGERVGPLPLVTGPLPDGEPKKRGVRRW